MSSPSPLNRLVPAGAKPHLRRAATLAALSGAVWPLQALAIAWSVAVWADPNATGPLWLMAVAFGCLGVLRAVLDRIGARAAFRAADLTLTDCRQRLMDRETRTLSRRGGSADLAALLTQKTALLVPYLSRYRPAMSRVMLVPPLILILSFYVSWAVGVVLLVAGPMIPVFMALVGMAAKEASERQMVEIGDINRLLIDRISALPDLRLLNATDRSVADFEARADGLRARTMAVLRVAFLSSTVLELFSAIGVAMVAVYVGFALLGELTFGYWATPLTLGQGVFVLLLAPEYFQPLRDLAAAWHDRAAAQAVAQEIADLESRDVVAILGTGAQAVPLAGPATITIRGLSVRRGGVDIDYPDVDLAAGGSLAIWGGSGTGKSTLLDVLAGVLPAETGHVIVAGQPLSDETADAWRARLGHVPQSVHFRDVTLRDFLDPERRGADLAPALQAAKAEGIVAALPDGLATRLGETGAGVSGGEARRLLLARAFYSQADVILADEPTADLDATTAGQVIEALCTLSRSGRTVVAVTHDPRLREALDAVLELEARE